MKRSCRRNVPLDWRVADAPNTGPLAGFPPATHLAFGSASEDGLHAVIQRRDSSTPCGSYPVVAGGWGMALALFCGVLGEDDSGKRDVQETRLAFVRASKPATDARRLVRQRRSCCVQQTGMPAIWRDLLRDSAK